MHAVQEHGSPPTVRKFPRTLFVLKLRENPYGDTYGKEDGHWGDGDGKQPLSSGLFNSARMVVEMLEAEGVPVKLVHVVDNNKIHKEAVEFKADLVIIEAFWVVPEKFDELRRVMPKTKFVIRNHSETPFLANEGIAFDWTMKYVTKPNVWMSCNAPRMLEETRFLVQTAHPDWTPLEVHRRVVYLPNYYPAENPVFEPGHVRDVLNVGCFGAIRPLKNHMEQAIGALKAARTLGKKLHFHINGGRLEMGGSPILKNLIQLFDHLEAEGHKLVMHRWRPHDEFKKLIASMDVVCQVSFSETFNIVAADAVMLGVPIAASSEIPWSSKFYRADPVDSTRIGEVIVHAYKTKHRWPCVNPSLGGLRRYNAHSRLEWLKLLHELG
jgi:hypothetical protein